MPTVYGRSSTLQNHVKLECLRNTILPVMIEDASRNEYLEALAEYRKEDSTTKLTRLFEREQVFYFDKCRYFC